jgi:hypothetical protein
LFTTGLSLAFAFTSISLHEAMTAFASGKGADHGAADVGLAAGIELTTSWAVVPFAIAIAWLTLRIRWLAIPAGMIAAASSWFTAWLFAWPVESAITTTIPCLVIQALGYHHLSRIPTERGLDRCARIVAIVGTVWLLVALVFDAVVPLLRGQPFQLYDSPSFWMDVRFYFGWAIGLMVAPSPYRRTEPV